MNHRACGLRAPPEGRQNHETQAERECRQREVLAHPAWRENRLWFGGKRVAVVLLHDAQAGSAGREQATRTVERAGRKNQAARSDFGLGSQGPEHRNRGLPGPCGTRTAGRKRLPPDGVPRQTVVGTARQAAGPQGVASRRTGGVVRARIPGSESGGRRVSRHRHRFGQTIDPRKRGLEAAAQNC